ncbi:MAG: M48 family metalloprotease [Phycisphaera sp.]|nr:M48 family metalloprotease [Phycisphaera sp.]
MPVYNLIGALIWLGFGLVALGVMDGASRRLAAAFRREPERAAARRSAYVQRLTRTVLGVGVGAIATVITLGVPHGWAATTAGAVIIVGVLLACFRFLYRAERVLRGSNWNEAGMFRYFIYTMLSPYTPIVIATIGALVTQWGFDTAGIEAPQWQGAVWVLIGMVARYVVPLRWLVGPLRPLTGPVAERYAEWGAAPDGEPGGSGDLPSLYVIDTANAQIANAFASWGARRGAYVSITDYLLEKLSTDEAAAVLMHELAHHRYRHILLYEATAFTWQAAFTVAMIAIGWGSLTWGLLIYVAQLLLIHTSLSRRCEITCDRFAAERCGDASLYGRALTRLYNAALAPASIGDQEEMNTHPNLITRLRAIGAMPDGGASLRFASETPRRVKVGLAARLVGGVLAIATLVIPVLRGQQLTLVSIIVALLVASLVPGAIRSWAFRREPGNEHEPVEFERSLYPTRSGSTAQFVLGWIMIILGGLFGALAWSITFHPQGEPFDADGLVFIWTIALGPIAMGASMVIRFQLARRDAQNSAPGVPVTPRVDAEPSGGGGASDEPLTLTDAPPAGVETAGGVVRERPTPTPPPIPTARDTPSVWRSLWRAVKFVVFFLGGLTAFVLFGFVGLTGVLIDAGVWRSAENADLHRHSDGFNYMAIGICFVVAGLGLSAVIWYLHGMRRDIPSTDQAVVTSTSDASASHPP